MNKKSFVLQFCVVTLASCLLKTVVYAQNAPKLLPLTDLKKFYPSNARTISEQFQKTFNNKVDAHRGTIDLSKYLKPASLKDNLTDAQLAAMKSFSWKTFNAVTPAKNQGNSGTCWAFAVTGAIEANYIIRRSETLDLAEQDLIDCGCRNKSVCSPAKGPDLLTDPNPFVFYKNLIQTGMNVETANLYKGDGNCNVCGTCNQKIRKPYGIDAMGWVEPINGVSTVIETKRALLKYGPVVIGIQLPAGSKFGSLKGTDIFHETITDYTSASGHIVSLVGWNDTKKAWLIKNSWGTGWGDNGFGWLGYGSNREATSGRQYVIARMPTGLLASRPK